ncbi:GNAT family N-acetyltransferase [Hyphobacterium marinum]|uniref:GNAT family N-acetyltransferase n=1 Tax=Hyphobacterium marinum TaxID=3116574 RepID=A0ABU7LXD2_9PROT|nr:GNAT family N-acetyltransferase [Hyphobacterium sp. Y6023]MEE2565650.1 GNAT family N-acetyltransferase [Hyphobacterium sp. Y6023]
MHSGFETGRLTVRPFEVSDAPDVARMAGDPGVARMIGSAMSPYPVIAAELWILTVRAGWDRKRPPNYAFAVTEKTGALAGSCGMFKRRGGADWEIGYWIGRPFWGKGYATEAGTGLMEWARESLGAERFVARHFEDNPASGKVLEKLGFAYTGDAEPVFSLGRMGHAGSLDMVCET